MGITFGYTFPFGRNLRSTAAAAMIRPCESPRTWACLGSSALCWDGYFCSCSGHVLLCRPADTPLHTFWPPQSSFGHSTVLGQGSLDGLEFLHRRRGSIGNAICTLRRRPQIPFRFVIFYAFRQEICLRQQNGASRCCCSCMYQMSPRGKLGGAYLGSPELLSVCAGYGSFRPKAHQESSEKR
jgi:hypothetical protein